jgi:hypothetical protein
MAGRFPLLLDEHVPRSLAHALRRRGWTAVRVVDFKTDLGLGANDEQVFTYAMEHGYVVLSSDERALWRPVQHREQGDPFSRRALLASDRDRVAVAAAAAQERTPSTSTLQTARRSTEPFLPLEALFSA